MKAASLKIFRCLLNIAHMSNNRDSIIEPTVITLPRSSHQQKGVTDEDEEHQEDTESCCGGRSAGRCDPGVVGLYNDRHSPRSRLRELVRLAIKRKVDH